MNLQNNKLKNFTPLPNEIFSLHLSTGELATYAVFHSSAAQLRNKR